VEASRGTAVIVGFIEESPSMNFYNSALVAIDGRIQFACRKLNLPNYGVFEERKIFSSGKRVQVFRYQGFNIAVLVCNDAWHPALPYLGVCQKADLFVTVINSSDSAMGKRFSNIESWSVVTTFYSRVFGIYNVMANRAGEEKFSPGRSLPDSRSRCVANECDPDQPEENLFRFWGGSEIVNPYGETVAKASLYQTDMICGEVEREVLRRKRIMLPYLRNDDPYFTHRELSRILYRKPPLSGAEDDRNR
jgi:predicted amidohydrolase